MKLPELPMPSIVLISDEQMENGARDVLIGYLVAGLNKLNPWAFATVG